MMEFFTQHRLRFERSSALWTRHDAMRFLKPKSPAKGALIDPRLDPIGAAEQKFASLAQRRAAFALERKYSPSQPRVPRGNPRGGQWTRRTEGGGGGRSILFLDDIGGGDGGDFGGDAFAYAPDGGSDFGAGLDLPEIVVSGNQSECDGADEGDGNGGLSWRRIAGDVPTGDSPPPEIPEKRPPTERQRNRIARQVAKQLPRVARSRTSKLEIIYRTAKWLIEKSGFIESYFDPPKTLAELQKNAETSRFFYDRHHIVERATAAKDGSENALIDAPENIVSIPRWKHWEINAVYETSSNEFGGLTPREYLRGRSWEERQRVGLNILRQAGVLK